MSSLLRAVKPPPSRGVGGGGVSRLSVCQRVIIFKFFGNTTIAYGFSDVNYVVFIVLFRGVVLFYAINACGFVGHFSLILYLLYYT